MTWKERTISRILLIICSMLADDDRIREEIRTLGNHLSASEWKKEAQA